MGKRKIEIEKIENQNKRLVAFSKRRKGLYGKADKFCKEFGAHIGIIVFSPGGNPFTYGDIDVMVERYLNDVSRLSKSVCSSSSSDQGEKQISKQLKKKEKRKRSEPVEEKQDERVFIHTIADKDEGHFNHTISDNLDNGPAHSIGSTSGQDDTVWNLEADNTNWNMGASLGDVVPRLPSGYDDSYVESIRPPLICRNEQLKEKQVPSLTGSSKQLEEKQFEGPSIYTYASSTGFADTDWYMNAPLIIPSTFPFGNNDDHNSFFESSADDVLADKSDDTRPSVVSCDEFDRVLESFFDEIGLADQRNDTFSFSVNPLPTEITLC